MTAKPNEWSSGKKKAAAKVILTSGIPLEMAVYDTLASSLDPDWIWPEYRFLTRDLTGATHERSLDFVVSIPSRRSALEETIQLYFIVECKYSNPNDSIWVFMPDMCPRERGVFDPWRPALWQEREFYDQHLLSESPDSLTNACAPRQEIPLCVRGEVLGFTESSSSDGSSNKNKRRPPAIATALHQARDCLHYLATERFRLFTKQWSQPSAIVFVPVVVTNAELHVLKPGIHSRLLTADGNDQLSLNEIGGEAARLLVRCPTSLDQVDRKWQRFEASHGQYDLSRIEKGLPPYKRERTLKAHIRNFFQTTPDYVTIIRLEKLPEFVREVEEWVNSLRFK